MTNITTRLRALLVLTFAVSVITLATTDAQQSSVNTTRAGVAIQGYDAVAYHQGAVTPGNDAFEHSWNGARWRFASAANRDLFAANPEKYAPKFGGYCAYAVSRGYTADIDPKAWKIVDGALYLNYSLRVQKLWEEDVPGNIEKAQKNWPGVLKK
jgi:YHS domain-containing protein